MTAATVRDVSRVGSVELAALREEFPVTRRMLYLDSAHQTPLCRTVRGALDAFHDEGLEMAGPKVTWLARAEETRCGR